MECVCGLGGRFRLFLKRFGRFFCDEFGDAHGIPYVVDACCEDRIVSLEKIALPKAWHVPTM
jgi:hypothetical protein